MECPQCRDKGVAAELRVTKTEGRGGWQLRRRRVCTVDDSHRLATVETPDYRSRDGNIRVLIERGQTSRYTEFSRQRIHFDLQEATLGRLSDKYIGNLVDYVEAHISTIALLSDDDGVPGWFVRDTDIRELLEGRLKGMETRIEHILYALSIRGRADLPSYTGWKKAEDFLEWLVYNYEDFKGEVGDLQRPSVRGRNPVSYEPPSRLPKEVVKARWRKEQGRRGPTQDFDRKKFERSIRQAMKGRPELDRVSREVADYVLRELADQPRVRTSQLAANVMSTLRRYDDIAYLRWATINKGYEQVNKIFEEAKSLIERPSKEPLKF